MKKNRVAIVDNKKLKNLKPVIPGRVSDELWNKSIGKLNNNPMNYDLGYKTRIIHLVDSVSRGYTTPMEAYEALQADYFPIHLETRPSAYQHLIAETDYLKNWERAVFDDFIELQEKRERYE